VDPFVKAIHELVSVMQMAIGFWDAKGEARCTWRTRSSNTRGLNHVTWSALTERRDNVVAEDPPAS